MKPESFVQPANKADGGSVSYKCHLCTFESFTLADFEVHMKYRHPDPPPDSWLPIVKSGASRPPIRLKVPAAKPNRQESLISTDTVSSPLLCPYCVDFRAAADEQSTLHEHIRVKHPVHEHPSLENDPMAILDTPFENDDEEEEDEPDNQLMNLVCCRCNVLISEIGDIEAMKLHACEAHNIREPEVCAACGRIFKGILSYERHVEKFCVARKKRKRRAKKSPRAFPKNMKCFHCDEMFSTVEGRYRHWRKEHNHGEKPMLHCNNCSERFEKLSDLRKHRRKVHGKRRGKVACAYCRSLKDKSTFDIQKCKCRRQNGQYRCPDCNQIIDGANKFSAHRMEMHPDSLNSPPKELPFRPPDSAEDLGLKRIMNKKKYGNINKPLTRLSHKWRWKSSKSEAKPANQGRQEYRGDSGGLEEPVMEISVNLDDLSTEHRAFVMSVKRSLMSLPPNQRNGAFQEIRKILQQECPEHDGQIFAATFGEMEDSNAEDFDQPDDEDLHVQSIEIEVE